MNAHDWSLILYTLCLQSAVGIFVVSRALVWNETEKAVRMRFLWVVGGLGVVGVFASLMHLGYPMNALRTMSNLGTSWLSREILLTAIFGLGGVASLVLERQQVGSTGLRNGVNALAGLAGVGLVFVMSMIYRTTAFPAWEHVSTTIGFLATAGLIGTVAVFAGQCCQKDGEEPKGLGAMLIGALALLAVQMASVAAHSAYLGTAGPEAQASAALLTGQYGILFWSRMILTVVGAAIFMPLAWRRWAEKQVSAMPQVAVAMVALVGLGELAGRVLFYAARVKIGL